MFGAARPSPTRRWMRACAAGALLCVALTAQATELTVSAASSLTNALKELAHLFEGAHPGVRLRFNFGASDALVQQVAAGAPVDVLATADALAMDKAVARKLVDPATRHDFVRNALVVVLPKDDDRPIGRLAELGGPGITRIALGNPASVPAGRYAQGALEQAGLWPLPEGKAVYAQSVRQALDYVARGEADAGLVYATDVAIRGDRLRMVFAVPTGTPIVYPAAVVTGARQAELGAAYIAWLLAPDTQARLARYGFKAP